MVLLTSQEHHTHPATNGTAECMVQSFKEICEEVFTATKEGFAAVPDAVPPYSIGFRFVAQRAAQWMTDQDEN